VLVVGLFSLGVGFKFVRKGKGNPKTVNLKTKRWLGRVGQE
jgi:hypothetical protein